MASWEEYLLEFKAWYVSVDGFGQYLQYFLGHYGDFFREAQETHAFVYTKLHKEFSSNLESAVNAWLASKGLSEEHLTSILECGQGNAETDGIVTALLAMMEYHTWIQYIFALKKNPAALKLAEDAYREPGWQRIGDADVVWDVRWWERWTDGEWDDWWRQRRDWEMDEWEDWWSKRDVWQGDWTAKQREWGDRTWTHDSAAHAAAGYGAAPSQPVAGHYGQLQTPHSVGGYGDVGGVPG
eukprot:TRINITY_DN35357_c0_g1_i1.p1 TRINITY_DN35357_c0_g1~~TRINITY_DN35357_c0_g1_i1.p1  ORF type:complete len:240 (-),score=58.06 TRINITY_DN35357_c0_g1_i1:213-932(-)